MSVLTIKTAIKNKLDDMGTLKAVFEYETGNPDGKYPFATVTLRNGDGIFRTTRHNQRRYGYWIRVYQEQSKQGQGISVAEDIAANVINELLTAFDMDTTLSGVCKFVDVVSYAADYSNRELDVRILEIEVDAHDIVASL